ncbi:uncharacterized protein LOC131215141 [Anopheles bellator]|uniref:uncharacterized protein LOC131215141 n=1 Tax=Anopheles bellator TaxID=139047 RepID=UPI002647368F|nr:uncharacterized protein LOC131215141 [Anopheles bellator]
MPARGSEFCSSNSAMHCATPPAGPSRSLSLVLLSLSLLVPIFDGSRATIASASTGVVRENSVAPKDSSVPPPSPTPASIANEIDQSSGWPTVSGEGSATTTITSTTTTIASSSIATSIAATSLRPATEHPVPERTRDQETHPEVPDFPSNCSEFSASPIQLVYHERARIQKCCPPGQMIQPLSNFRYECVPGNRELRIETIEAHFYGNNECIEVGDEPVSLPVVSQDLCHDAPQALMYSADQGDELFVMQNGSLLVLEYGSLVSVFDSYCVEMTSDARLLAKVCEEVHEPQIAFLRVFIAVGVTLATLALTITALSYTFVPKLNDTFGYLIAAHASAFAVGTIFVGLARCGDQCVGGDGGTHAVLELFANAFLGTSVFVFFLMNVLNTVYVAYYIPNGLEYDGHNKRDVYVLIGVLYTISLIPLLLLPKGGLISIVFIYYAGIALTHALSTYYTRRLTSGIYLHINDTAVSGQTKINHARLNDISKQTRLCRMEAGFSIVCWIAFAVLMLATNMSDFPRIAAVYIIVVQGLFVGVVFVAGSQKWIIIRECWSNSGSVDLRVLENGIEMKRLRHNDDTDDRVVRIS